MTEVIAYEGIPGRTNLELAQKTLSDQDIPSRGQMTGFSFASIPPISVNNLLVEEEHLQQAKKLIEALASDGWLISRQVPL